MTRLEAIEEQIKQLSAEEYAQFRKWFEEQDADAWDNQIERDAKAGKLDKLFEKAREEHRSGKTREI